MKAAKAAQAQASANVAFVASGKAAVTVEQAKAAASVAGTKAQLAQAQVTASTNGTEQRKNSQRPGRRTGPLTAANAELADAVATRDNAYC